MVVMIFSIHFNAHLRPCNRDHTAYITFHSITTIMIAQHIVTAYSLLNTFLSRCCWSFRCSCWVPLLFCCFVLLGFSRCSCSRCSCRVAFFFLVSFPYRVTVNSWVTARFFGGKWTSCGLVSALLSENILHVLWCGRKEGGLQMSTTRNGLQGRKTPGQHGDGLRTKEEPTRAARASVA